MFKMNVISIAGSLGKDAELKHLPNGDPILIFSVADSQGRDKPTIWWRCSLFGKRAEALQQYLVKGQAVTVAGQITEREYTDKDGQKKKSQDVRVSEIALQGGKREQPSSAPAKQAPKGDSGFNDMSDDIPW
jgi:single-strand DNA-binding protein